MVMADVTGLHEVGGGRNAMRGTSVGSGGWPALRPRCNCNAWRAGLPGEQRCIAGPTAPIEQIDPAAWHRALDVVLTSQILSRASPVGRFVSGQAISVCGDLKMLLQQAALSDWKRGRARFSARGSRRPDQQTIRTGALPSDAGTAGQSCPRRVHCHTEHTLVALGWQPGVCFHSLMLPSF